MRHKTLRAAAVVLVLHLLAGAFLLAAAGPQSGTALGLCAVAYLAGVKHSYDWDHIAAIDNSSRRFAAQGRYHTGVGLAFSLGHCTVVILACALARIVMLSGVATVTMGMFVGVVCGLGFVVPPLLAQHVSEQKPFKLFGINSIYWLIAMALSGSLLAMWH